MRHLNNRASNSRGTDPMRRSDPGGGLCALVVEPAGVGLLGAGRHEIQQPGMNKTAGVAGVIDSPPPPGLSPVSRCGTRHARSPIGDQSPMETGASGSTTAVANESTVPESLVGLPILTACRAAGCLDFDYSPVTAFEASRSPFLPRVSTATHPWSLK